jgi:hypothetical protein
MKMAAYRVDKVVGENPKVDTNVEKNEPNYGSDDSRSNLKDCFRVTKRILPETRASTKKRTTLLIAATQAKL